MFFSGARTAAANVVGAVNDGWKVAMGTLAFERGASTLGQQVTFLYEFMQTVETAKRRGVNRDPVVRQRIAEIWSALELMRLNALRSMSSLESGAITPLTAIHKLYWASLHRAMGELAIDVAGPDGMVLPEGPYELDLAQRLFLWTRADTIYGGSNQIQRNVAGERALGLPPEPKV